MVNKGGRIRERERERDEEREQYKLTMNVRHAFAATKAAPT